MTLITGHTRVLGIVADPIDHVKTPQGINAIALRGGINAVMVPFHVAPDGLAVFFAGLRQWRNFDGMIVTVPHKEAALPLCDVVSAHAAEVGAVNAVRRDAAGNLVGDMFDGFGFIRGLERAGIAVAGRHVYVAGAGGAACAIVMALADAGVAALTIANRTQAKASRLAARLQTRWPAIKIAIGTRDPAGHDLAINTTSAGLHPDDGMPFDVERIDPDCIVADIIMQPAMTSLLQAAERQGARIHLGMPMLEGQLDLMAAFLGVTRNQAERPNEDGGQVG